jgi:hypothetical protein
MQAPSAKPSRRVKILAISGNVLEELWRTGNKIQAEVTEGLPEDAKLLGINYRADSGVAALVFESKKFNKVAVGDIPPYIDVTLRTLPQT